MVLPGECDDAGHLNVAWYAQKFDIANHHIYAKIALTPARRRTSGVACVAIATSTDHCSELHSSDIVVARSAIVGFKNPFLHFVTHLSDATNEIVAARFEEVAT